ncbi:hypothetical protein HBI25_056940 [Parastagonospora nodorum]|uniref:Uncharacterized protein n=1 Tax=Phaeosphaeria nodorum (strain SN15 / ATCC MYA-4574 / FGSC 10173) TaxID=321614 RepID=A0A7U2NQH2_PHANO|nr:hypothetical protein HBI10_179610 [Parastagonospora nodorum]QRD06643.1 hypothetical protein JI435_446190 [Parastagonospora nodorum SN15]KAH4014946.1 hypothetical protein HBI13_164740 [Parastagonospora nodorum]KAH4024397.1 hypothetical protein HBI09_160170 [Parastagonospora nodorum]KAH4846832.1 hypothetical protein HBH75_168890 [Parastagonospora nodorum]
MYENEAQSEPPLQILLMRHHRHRPTILSDCLIVISIKGSFSNFVGVNDRMQLVPGTAALWLRRTFYGIGE